MNFKPALLIVLAILISKTATANIDLFPIVGGTPVQSKDPVAASTVFLISFASDGNQWCTGSIIDQDLIITAAHCLTGTSSSSMGILFGTSMESSVDSRGISKALIAPEYAENNLKNRWDIALIRFEGGLPDGFRSIPVLTKPDALTRKQNVTIAGFGTSALNRTDAGSLKKAEVQISNPSFSAIEVELAQSKKAGVCNGDSGGPAFFATQNELILWGVANQVSDFDSKVPCGKHSVFTNLASPAVSKWLESARQQIRAVRAE